MTALAASPIAPPIRREPHEARRQRSHGRDEDAAAGGGASIPLAGKGGTMRKKRSEERCAVCGGRIIETRHGWAHVGREHHPPHWPQPMSQR